MSFLAERRYRFDLDQSSFTSSCVVGEEDREIANHSCSTNVKEHCGVDFPGSLERLNRTAWQRTNQNTHPQVCERKRLVEERSEADGEAMARQTTTLWSRAEQKSISDQNNTPDLRAGMRCRSGDVQLATCRSGIDDEKISRMMIDIVLAFLFISAEINWRSLNYVCCEGLSVWRSSAHWVKWKTHASGAELNFQLFLIPQCLKSILIK